MEIAGHQYVSHGPPTEVEPGVLVPVPGEATFSGVRIGDETYSVRMTVDMTPNGVRPTSLTLTSDAGTEITGVILRGLKVATLMRRVIDAATVTAAAHMTSGSSLVMSGSYTAEPPTWRASGSLTYTPDGALPEIVTYSATQVEDPPAGPEVIELGPVVSQEEAERFRKQGPNPETLDAVAMVYRLALQLNKPPSREVEQVFGLRRSTALSWVNKARQRGHLEPAGQVSTFQPNGVSTFQPGAASGQQDGGDDA